VEGGFCDGRQVPRDAGTLTNFSRTTIERDEVPANLRAQQHPTPGVEK
jgi:hypothetical protein